LAHPSTGVTGKNVVVLMGHHQIDTYLDEQLAKVAPFAWLTTSIMRGAFDGALPGCLRAFVALSKRAPSMAGSGADRGAGLHA
jgi:hypothetical protein